jgi:uncharacterized cupredoxin-like copper-binding protein
MTRTLSVAAMAAMLGLLVVACGGGAASPTAAGTTINADLKEFSITLDKSTVAAGDVAFTIANSGTTEHEFVIIKTDTPAADLPTTDGGTEVDESAFEPVDEQEDIEAGASPTLDVNLSAGHYAIICNLPAHFSSGMHADLTVE